MNVYFSSALINVKQLEELTNVGFQGWEVIAEGPQKVDKDLLSLIEYAESSYDLGISVHTPFSDLNIASLNAPIWQETLRQIEAVIEGLADHADVFVIHPGYISPLAAFCPEKALVKNKQALIRLVQHAKKCQVKATVENMVNVDFLLGRFPHEIEDMRLDGLGFTFDVGHANTADAIDSFSQVKIDHVHLHDNNGQADEHLPLGLGNINWERTMHAFRHYKGIFVLESKTLDEGIKSLTYLKRITR
ncbi:MAG: sugar phosphate isomerase/epimerase [Euryarchaeota archaeon]|jgi:Sugar phosphate isomerases/epimerases|nr:sugar phosphate isomerase/epimerase [Euryarchaeota archaeon]